MPRIEIMNCYLSRNYKTKSTAGGKAKTDIEELMENWGFKNIGLEQTLYTHKIKDFILTLAGVIKGCFCLKRGDILFLQYPVKKYFTFICRIAHLKGAKVVTLIHDLGSFRRKKLTVAQEIRRVSHADYIIAANPAMQQWLIEQGCLVPTGIQTIWDYLSKTPTPQERGEISRPYGIVYAGGLSKRKNAFLYTWINEISRCVSDIYIYIYIWRWFRAGGGLQFGPLFL